MFVVPEVDDRVVTAFRKDEQVGLPIAFQRVVAHAVDENVDAGSAAHMLDVRERVGEGFSVPHTCGNSLTDVHKEVSSTAPSMELQPVEAAAPVDDVVASEAFDPFVVVAPPHRVRELGASHAHYGTVDGIGTSVAVVVRPTGAEIDVDSGGSAAELDSDAVGGLDVEGVVASSAFKVQLLTIADGHVENVIEARARQARGPTVHRNGDMHDGFGAGGALVNRGTVVGPVDRDRHHSFEIGVFELLKTVRTALPV